RARRRSGVPLARVPHPARRPPPPPTPPTPAPVLAVAPSRPPVNLRPRVDPVLGWLNLRTPSTAIFCRPHPGQARELGEGAYDDIGLGGRRSLGGVEDGRHADAPRAADAGGDAVADHRDPAP